jgi:hypothetical protein
VLFPISVRIHNINLNAYGLQGTNTRLDKMNTRLDKMNMSLDNLEVRVNQLAKRSEAIDKGINELMEDKKVRDHGLLKWETNARLAQGVLVFISPAPICTNSISSPKRPLH